MRAENKYRMKNIISFDLFEAASYSRSYWPAVSAELIKNHGWQHGTGKHEGALIKKAENKYFTHVTLEPAVTQGNLRVTSWKNDRAFEWDEWAHEGQNADQVHAEAAKRIEHREEE